MIYSLHFFRFLPPPDYYVKYCSILNHKLLHTLDILLYDFSDKSDKHSLKSMIAVAGRWVVKTKKACMQRARHLGCIPVSIHSLFMYVYAHTYVTSVNITWSVSNLVPQLLDSIHSIERPVMRGRGQHLQAWTDGEFTGKQASTKGLFPPIKLCVPLLKILFSWHSISDFLGRIKRLIIINPNSCKQTIQI